MKIYPAWNSWVSAYILYVYILWQNPNQTAVVVKNKGAGKEVSKVLLRAVLGEATFECI